MLPSSRKALSWTPSSRQFVEPFFKMCISFENELGAWTAERKTNCCNPCGVDFDPSWTATLPPVPEVPKRSHQLRTMTYRLSRQSIPRLGILSKDLKCQQIVPFVGRSPWYLPTYSCYLGFSNTWSGVLFLLFRHILGSAGALPSEVTYLFTFVAFQISFLVPIVW